MPRGDVEDPQKKQENIFTKLSCTYSLRKVKYIPNGRLRAKYFLFELAMLCKGRSHDVVILSNINEEFQKLIDIITKEGDEFGLKLNKDKTNTMGLTKGINNLGTTITKTTKE
ncbi:hypothetical protein WA026_016470 [Henosepilachna vigintioctopunctata]|uniref:Reverse transcriptase domain-containing protein n=1 Tax=Henosepilachna vigintioctopunctata TaxID=420089 RepID=A0AAW1UNS3_9CUCU